MLNLKIILYITLHLSFVLSYQMNDITLNELIEPEILPEEKDQDDKVTITYCYESLCPGCRQFDEESLVPVVTKLAPYLNLNIYPYGNAQTSKLSNGSYEISCQHGPEECYGNRLHACAIHILGNITKAVLFNGCMMAQNGDGSNDPAADLCGRRMNIDAKPIKKCAKSDEGLQLEVKFGKLTKNAGYPEECPFVKINGKETSTDDFFDTVCKAFNKAPKACLHKAV